MEQLFTQVNSKNNAFAIVAFVSQFSDVTSQTQTLNKDTCYLTTYGMSKTAFQNRINTEMAEGILGLNKP